MARSTAQAATLLGLLLSLAGCLDDLAPEAKCPPDEQHPAGDCLPAVTVAEPGCLGTGDPEQVRCLAGKRETCDCQPGECPSSADACYPPGDCPPEVVNAVGAEARCLRLEPSDFGNVIPQVYQCACGCLGCAAVCDGAGPVIGLVDDGKIMYGVPTIELEHYMPSSGRFGMYVRARGLANVTIGVATGDPADWKTLVWPVGYYLSTPLESFAETVFFDQQFVGGTPAYRWTKAAQKPSLVAFIPNQPDVGDAPIPTLYELDCVIPFVLPK